MKRVISFFYSTLLFFGVLLYLPRFLFLVLAKKKYRKSWSQRLGITPPSIYQKEGKRIWIHACSVGEIKAVAPLAAHWNQKEKGWQFFLSTTTETGWEEAKRSIPFASAHFFLPFDLPWIIRPLVRKVMPHRVVCTESDFWYHFLSSCKEIGAELFLVNGKISERSARAFSWFLPFSKQLFSHFDRLCVQGEHYAERFCRVGVPKEKIHLAPNLKYSAVLPFPSEEEKKQWKADWGIYQGIPVIAFGSTHAPEEKLLLPVFSRLRKRIPNLRLLLIPRHPERAEEIALLLETHHLPFQRTSRRIEIGKEIAVLLVDEMGKSTQCYSLSQVVVLGGSFVPGIGGHNILEPCFQGTPVLFGPHMEEQIDMVHWVQREGAGAKTSLEELERAIETFFTGNRREIMSQKGVALRETLHGAVQKTADLLEARRTKWEEL